MTMEFKIELMVSIAIIFGGMIDAFVFAVLADKYNSDKLSICAGIGVVSTVLGFLTLFLCTIWRLA